MNMTLTWSQQHVLCLGPATQTSKPWLICAMGLSCEYKTIQNEHSQTWVSYHPVVFLQKALPLHANISLSRSSPLTSFSCPFISGHPVHFSSLLLIAGAIWGPSGSRLVTGWLIDPGCRLAACYNQTNPAHLVLLLTILCSIVWHTSYKQTETHLKSPILHSISLCIVLFSLFPFDFPRKHY